MKLAGYRWLWAGALAFFYALALRAYYVGFFNDDAYFIIGSRSLLHGRFVELNQPGAPPILYYMPGYSLLLAPISAFSPHTFLPYQCLSILLTVGAIYLFWIYFRHLLSLPVLTAVIVLSSLNPLTVSLSGVVLSDVAYFFFTPLVLIAARMTWDRTSKRSWIGLAALAAWMFYLRPVGAAFSIALILALLLEQRWGKMLLCAVTSACIVAPLVLHNYLVIGHGFLYGQQFAATYRQGSPVFMLFSLLWDNGRYYARELFFRTLFRWPLMPGVGFLELTTVLAGTGFLLVGIGRESKRRWQKFPWLYLLVYMGALLSWSEQAGRYLLPILPMCVTGLFLGVEALEKRLNLKGELATGALILSLTLCLIPVSHILRVSLFEHTNINTPPEKTYGWIRSHTQPSDIFAAEIDARLYLLTGRSSIHIPKIYDSKGFEDWIRSKNIHYVMLFPTEFVLATRTVTYDPFPVMVLSSLLSNRRIFQPVFSESTEGSTIYAVKSSAGIPPPLY